METALCFQCDTRCVQKPVPCRGGECCLNKEHELLRYYASLGVCLAGMAGQHDVNVIDAEGQTALWKSLTSRRRRRHCDETIFFQAGAKIEKPFELFDEVLRTLVSKQSVSGDVKSLAVCTWLRRNSLYKLRMFNNRKSRESLDPFHLFGMYILSRFWQYPGRRLKTGFMRQS